MSTTDKTKCTLCNERNGSTRCEGCNTLFCLPCMNKHHDELTQQFQLLMDVRNEVKQSLDASRSTKLNTKQASSLVEIDTWERQTIQHVQRIAANARNNVNELIMKHMNEISDRFEQMSVQMQQQQKEGDYLENDIKRIKIQLDQLRNDIRDVNEKIRVDSSLSNNIAWDTLIYIVEEELPSTATSEPMQTKHNVFKEKKRSSLIAKGNNAMYNNESSNVVFPKNQSAVGTSKLNSTSVHIEQSNPFLYSDIPSRPSTQSRPTNMYLPVSDHPSTPNLSSMSVKKPPFPIICPHCKFIHLVYAIPSNSGFRCISCTKDIPSADRIEHSVTMKKK